VILAWELAYAQSQLDEIEADMDRDGLTLTDGKGRTYAHPGIASSDKLRRQIALFYRHLRLGSFHSEQAAGKSIQRKMQQDMERVLENNPLLS
jgi:hypothetical protein